MIKRNLQARLLDLAAQMPAITVTGPRQSGKTTLCRATFGDRAYRNLEIPDERRFAETDPRGFLASMPDGGIIDEAQQVPELFSYLQGDIDAHRGHHGRWILSGSQNFLLLASITQSLAGRTAITHLLPFELGEWRRGGLVEDTWLDQVLRGGFPALAHASVTPEVWLGSYIASYLERDVRQISLVGDLSRFRLFVELCAGRSGQEWNSAAVASDVGVSRATVDRWLSILETSFVVFRLRPYHRNLRKRIVKRPRLHMLDSGMHCYLLGIRDREQLLRHPLRGAVFESWVAAEILKTRVHRGLTEPLAYYRDQHGIEVDVITEHGSRVWLVEAKSGATYRPEMARQAIRVAGNLEPHLQPQPLVVYGGEPTADRSDAMVLAWNELDSAPWAVDESTGTDS